MKTGKILLLGIVGSFFFAFTFVLNRSMNITGGYWMYSAVLRYLFTLPILFLVLLKGKKYRLVLDEISKNPEKWILWSTVGFGFFYFPLTAASLYAESWFTCAMWQITIVAGVLLTPLFGKPIPTRNMACSLLILAGILLMQYPHMREGAGKELCIAFLLILVGAFSYPLGNRKMMTFCSSELSTLQRVFGMTLCSMPFWMACGVIAMIRSGLPRMDQCLQAFGVALFSGVIATVLFFKATDLAKDSATDLAIAEATQCGEVIFTLILGIIFLKDSVPGVWGWIGLGIIVAGMILNSVIDTVSK